jgi:uncharacterized protein (TIGR03382 family)
MVTVPDVTETTTITETFGLVQEGVAWFGPEDVTISIVVHPAGGGTDPDPTDPDPDPDPGGGGTTDPDPTDPGDGGGSTTDPHPLGGSDGTMDRAPPGGAISGGCSAAGTGGTPAWLLGLVLLAVLRRRGR